jgi:hypothetical protein
VGTTRPATNFSVAVALFSSTASAREHHQGAFAIFGGKDAPGHDYKESSVPSEVPTHVQCRSGMQAVHVLVSRRACFLKNTDEFQLTEFQGAMTSRARREPTVNSIAALLRLNDQILNDAAMPCFAATGGQSAFFGEFFNGVGQERTSVPN